jgi:guanylate kinase
MNKGTLYVLSAPSGCGKGTVLNELFKRTDNVFYSVSATTRSPREGEVDGVNYYFVTKERFLELVKSDGMLEYATFVDNYYGTPKAPIEQKLAEGKDVILEIETAGAMMVKSVCPEAVLIFMLPPSIEELAERLRGRGTESEEVISKRVMEAYREIRLANNYDYVFVNDDLSEAVDDLMMIMKSAKHLVNKNNDLIKGVLEKC